MDELNGKVAVVTGAASGIGLALARRLASEGMRVAMADIEVEPLEAAAAELAADGADVVTQVTDVSDGASVDALGDAVIDRFGSVHVVCNNAGVGGGGPMAGLTTADWQWVLGVNMWGVIHGTRVFLPKLQAQNEGHIVNTASLAGLVGPPFMGPYAASKFAVVGLSESLFHELRLMGSEVGVSVLCPAWVRTRIHESARNRPAALTNEATDAPAPGGPDAASMIAGVIASGLDPAVVADHVVDAIHSKRLWILTHEDSKDAVRGRIDAMLGDGVPAFQMPV